MDKIPPPLSTNPNTNKSLQEKLDKELEYIKPKPVVVLDIKMPMDSMMIFMIKWAIASIPALIILCVIFGIVFGILGGILTSTLGHIFH
jgi:hypothetical protein